VKNVVAFEHPHFLPVLCEVKLYVTPIASVTFVNDTLAKVNSKIAIVFLIVSCVQTACRIQNCLRVALLAELVLESLLELFELHDVALIFQERHDLIQMHILAHVLYHFLIPGAQKAHKVCLLLAVLRVAKI